MNSKLEFKIGTSSVFAAHNIDKVNACINVHHFSQDTNLQQKLLPWLWWVCSISWVAAAVAVVAAVALQLNPT